MRNDDEQKPRRLSPLKWALGFAGLVAVLVVCGGLPLYLRGLPPSANTPPTQLGGMIMAMLGVIAFAFGALIYGIILLTCCFTFDFRFPIFATLKYRAWLANLVVGLFLQGGVAFVALPFLHPLLLSFLPAQVAFIVAFFGPFVMMQFVMIWLMIWAPLDRMCIRRRMSAIGISPEQVKDGWYMGISDANRGTMKRFPSIEEDIGVLWLEASRILYYGDTQAWEVPHEKLLEIERKAEAGSTSAYFGGVNVIVRFLDAEGKERRVRLHPQGDWTRTMQTKRFNLLAERLTAWREKPSAGWFHTEPAGFAVEPRVQ